MLLVFLLIKEHLYLKLYLSGSKIGINEPIRADLYAGGGGLIRGVISVEERVSLFAGELIGEKYSISFHFSQTFSLTSWKFS